MSRRAGAALAGLAALLVLAGCEPPAPPPAAPPPVPARPAVRPVPPEPPAAPGPSGEELRRARAEAARRAAEAEPSAASRTMARYLEGLEAQLVARGRLRTDSGEGDGPLTVERLVEDFVTVALHEEYGGRGHARQPEPAPLRRWAAPVRVRVEFGDRVPAAQRIRDRDIVAGFAARLARITGHDIAMAQDHANMLILVVNEDERRGIGERLATAVPDMPAADIAALTALSPQNSCTAFAYGRGGAPVHAQVVVVIRAELPPLSRTACFHEEMAHGLGLSNDDASVHPSIFNDDDQFAYLTRHDELLLAMLYDPRLRPGMTEAEVRPLAATIAAELLQGRS